MSDSDPPIYVIKKKGAHGGHHGGAWKVAYADFVTAMMALFIVLWLLSSSEEVKKAVGGYFQDPEGSGNLMGSTLAGVGEGLVVRQDDMNQLKEAIEKAMKEIPKFDEIKDQVKITVTGEGLRIELMEGETGTFFKSGSAGPSQSGSEMLRLLAQQLSKLPNQLLIEGHTDSKPFSPEGEYGNWELSADRANAARRLMEDSGIRRDQVAQVRGFADQSLLVPADPVDPSNRRISVIVKYREEEKKHRADQVSKKPGEKDHAKPVDGHGVAGHGAPAKANEPAGDGAKTAEGSANNPKEAKPAVKSEPAAAKPAAGSPTPSVAAPFTAVGKVSGKAPAPAKGAKASKPPAGSPRPAKPAGATRGRTARPEKDLAAVRAPS